MKKRLSLLMVLMMVLSLVPMSAFATAGTVPGGAFSVEDTEETTKTVTVKLTQAEMTQINATTAGHHAKLTLNKGEFTGATKVVSKSDTAGYAKDPAGTLALVGSDVAYLTLDKATFQTTLQDEVDFYVTFNVELDQEDIGDVTLTVDEVEDSNVYVSKELVIGVITESTEGDMKITVKDAETKIGFDGGELSRVTISDIDELDGVATKLVLELDEDLEWDTTKTVVTGTGVTKAFDDNKLTLTLPNEFVEVIVTPFVLDVAKGASTGDVVLDVTAYDAAGKSLESTDAVIGQIADYDVAIEAEEKGEKVIPSLYGGEEATIKVTLSGVVGSFTNDRTIDFVLDGADVTTASIKNITGLDSLDYDVEGDLADDGEFSFKVNGTDLDELEFEMEIFTDVNKDGAVTLTAESRDFDDLTVDVAEVTPAYTVEVVKTTEIKKGESLATADIVIKEAKAGMFETDQFLVLSLNDNYSDGLVFGSDYELAFTNNMDADDDLVSTEGTSRGDKNTLVLEITDASNKEAGTITISDVLVNVSGSEVDGIKDLETFLVTADDLDEAIELSTGEEEDADYAVAYVNVVKEYGVTATTTVFVIGSKAYTVNGVAMTANEAPYVAGKGYTMLPVRALAESLGLKADWNSNTKTATFSNDSKVASVTLGSDTMYVNGTPIPLNAKAEIKNGSTFIELRSLASAFSVNLEWDAATKTVTIIG